MYLVDDNLQIPILAGNSAIEETPSSVYCCYVGWPYVLLDPFVSMHLRTKNSPIPFDEELFSFHAHSFFAPDSATVSFLGAEHDIESNARSHIRKRERYLRFGPNVPIMVQQ
jgi:hypothetical protein